LDSSRRECGGVSSYTVTPYIGATAQIATNFTCGLGAGAIVCNAVTVTAIIDGLTPGTAYTFTVAASNSYGEGARLVRIQLAQPPHHPRRSRRPTATAGYSSAGLSFSAAMANGSPVSHYTVTPYIGATAEPATTFTCGARSSAIDCGVSPVTTYAANGSGTMTVSVGVVSAGSKATPSPSPTRLPPEE
jgi:titin